jgi:hypothetical protein
MKTVKAILIALALCELVSSLHAEQGDIPPIPKTKPHNIPDDVAAEVRRACADEWRGNYEMRLYCEQEQFKAYRELRGDP